MEVLTTERNGVVDTGKPKGKGKPRSGKAPTKRERERAAARGRAVCWAHRYTTGAVALSAFLNGWASIIDSGSSHPVGVTAAAVVGGIVPVAVWSLCRVGGNLVRAGWRRMAGAVGAVASFVLALSLVHCTHGIASLTGAPWVLAALLAVGIDLGLVVSEVSAVLVQEGE
jgi:hypothetical protein